MVPKTGHLHERGHMAKPLLFRYGKTDLSFQFEKLDRDKLYGTVETEVLDEKNRPCQLSILGGDGKTVVGRGASALLYLDFDGCYTTRTQLKPVSADGQPLSSVPSSLGVPIALEKRATVEEYLSHNIKSVYLLTQPFDADALMAELHKGVIYTFPFSYRGGLNPKQGFLLANADGVAVLAVGQQAQIEFVRLSEVADPDEEAAGPVDEAQEDDDMDFGMM